MEKQEYKKLYIQLQKELKNIKDKSEKKVIEDKLKEYRNEYFESKYNEELKDMSERRKR